MKDDSRAAWKGRAMVSRCLLLSATIFSFISGRAAPAQTRREPARPTPGGDFTLTDHNGKPFDLRDHRGKVILLFFGYTSCTEACPVILGRINTVFKQLGSDSEKALAVFV